MKKLLLLLLAGFAVFYVVLTAGPMGGAIALQSSIERRIKNAVADPAPEIQIGQKMQQPDDGRMFYYVHVRAKNALGGYESQDYRAYVSKNETLLDVVRDE